MIRTGINRGKAMLRHAAGYVWPSRQRSIVREPDGFYTVKRSTLSRGGGTLKRTPFSHKPSEKQALKQAKWNVITQSKIACGLGCKRCGCNDRPGRRLEGHHTLPTGQGGEWGIDNHTLTCRPCHRWIHRNPLAAALAGLLILRKVESSTPAASARPEFRFIQPVHDKAPSQREAMS